MTKARKPLSDEDLAKLNIHSSHIIAPHDLLQGDAGCMKCVACTCWDEGTERLQLPCPAKLSNDRI